MSKPTDEMPDNPISPATLEEVASLAELYAKQFNATGYSKCAQPERREELVAWIRMLCKEGKLWVIRDNDGPITLGHYEPDQKKVITIVTRDGMERNGYGRRMLSCLASKEPLIKIVPVTDAGLALARKCGFTQEKGSQCTWTLGANANQLQ